jgi:hypothetical protein
LLLSSIVNGEKNRQYRYAKMLSGSTPVFSQFGQNIYASDVVQMCIDKTAKEISKLQPKHIRTDNKGMQSTPKSSFNRLFKYKPNELMTTRDFLEKTVWLLFLNYNAFIYPKFNLIEEAGGYTRDYTGFYPLNPTTVTFLQDLSNTLFVKLQFANGSDFTIAYSDIIHLRKKYSVNDVMGGGYDGKPDNQALLKVLSINDTLLQGLDKAIKTSLSVRGIVRINTMLDDDKQEKERHRLEEAIDDGTSGIIALDLKGDYIPLNPDPKLIDKETLQFLQNKILNWYDMPVKIFTGEFSDEDYQAWYEQALEPIVIGLGQAFTPTVFSQMEIAHGNEIVFYQRDMQYLSTKSKLELIKIGGEQGLLQDNQKLALLGYPPIENGHRITQSLNFIDRELVNDYQMYKAKTGKKEDKDE